MKMTYYTERSDPVVLTTHPAVRLVKLTKSYTYHVLCFVLVCVCKCACYIAYICVCVQNNYYNLFCIHCSCYSDCVLHESLISSLKINISGSLLCAFLPTSCV